MLGCTFLNPNDSTKSNPSRAGEPLPEGRKERFSAKKAKKAIISQLGPGSCRPWSTRTYPFRGNFFFLHLPSLTPRTVEALVYTSDWLRGNEMSFYKEPTIDDLMFYKELEVLDKGK
ncbi:hypothetical protein FF1_021474 [Malus domestica]